MKKAIVIIAVCLFAVIGTADAKPKQSMYQWACSLWETMCVAADAATACRIMGTPGAVNITHQVGGAVYGY